MAEYIERDACLEKVCEACNMQFGDDAPCEPSECFMREKLMAIPTAEVEPVRHTTFKDGECMACGWFGDCVDTPHYNYCPWCGARADGGAENA